MTTDLHPTPCICKACEIRAEQLKARKHIWILDAMGDRDNWQLDIENHNGPGCEVCHETFCEHCHDVDSLAGCEGERRG